MAVLGAVMLLAVGAYIGALLERARMRRRFMSLAKYARDLSWWSKPRGEGWSEHRWG